MNASTEATPQVRSGKVMNYALWALQVLLALTFVVTGLMKVFKPVDELVVTQAWVAHFSPLMVKGIGVLELLGAIGLIVPSASRIMPKLTVFAALGLFILMAGAAGTHVLTGEPDKMGASVILAVLCLVIAWGRSRGAVILPK